MSHEYVFHFTKERWYYFSKDQVGRRSNRGTLLPPLDTWEVPPAKGNGHHKAAFSEELVRIPILSTTPERGVVLDPFCGSGTSLIFARKHGFRCIGIDLKREYCEGTVAALQELSGPLLNGVKGTGKYANKAAKRSDAEQARLFEPVAD